MSERVLRVTELTSRLNVLPFDDETGKAALLEQILGHPLPVYVLAQPATGGPCRLPQRRRAGLLARGCERRLAGGRGVDLGDRCLSSLHRAGRRHHRRASTERSSGATRGVVGRGRAQLSGPSRDDRARHRGDRDARRAARRRTRAERRMPTRGAGTPAQPARAATNVPRTPIPSRIWRVVTLPNPMTRAAGRGSRGASSSGVTR